MGATAQKALRGKERILKPNRPLKNSKAPYNFRPFKKRNTKNLKTPFYVGIGGHCSLIQLL